MSALDAEIFRPDAKAPRDGVKEIILQLRYQRHLNLLIGLIIHAIFFLVVFLRGIIIRTPLRQYISSSRLISQLRPSQYPRHHIQAYNIFKKLGVTIPTFSQLVALSSFTLLLTFFSVFGYGFRHPSNPEYVPPTAWFIRYIATRLGVMSFVLMPLLMLTAGRMNFLVWMTHWSYDSWNIFHRWIGRLALVFAVLHTVLYLVYAHLVGRLWVNFSKLYWNCGFVALAMYLVLSSFPSARFIRRMSYEVFLVGHVLSTVVCLVVLFYHTLWRFANEWLYITILYWAIDRLSRAFKVTSLLPLSGTLTDYGTVMRLDVYLPKDVRIRPGQFAHLRFPEVRYMESHPFSIAANNHCDSVEGKVSGYKHGNRTHDTEWSPLIPSEERTECSSHKAVSFIIRPYDGMTRPLYELLAAKESVNRSISVKVYMEGPYGHEHDLKEHTSVLLLAGGVGISFTLPYLLNWSTIVALRENKPKLRAVWIVRSLMEVDSVLDLLESLDGEAKESVEIWYTGQEEDLEAHAEASAAPSLWVPWIPRVRFGRPRMEELTSQALNVGEIESPSLGLLGSYVCLLWRSACGPGGMLDHCRFVVERMMFPTAARIHYVEEASTV
ncbi:ferric reductase like transmembrane component-domain-containing protein [Desarmillaria tabescens]|uniref:ferric-chelate reductase (NADPH) n=1 Tax=Armillaria tabescens TaxID=1929756 RepID=A0AA39NDE7_ARMTA|nr:ferric reductase like transmembrane component-domain-containing protein [Desarmillaria tabescens]KAK0463606.1 ferric reductase like transmembrane component-domain-containing protein [Desarmillaria tabescens]